MFEILDAILKLFSLCVISDEKIIINGPMEAEITRFTASYCMTDQSSTESQNSERRMRINTNTEKNETIF